MTSLPNSLPPIELTITLAVAAERSEILAGLDAWLQLGLLSDRQVRQIAQTYFTCSLRTIETAALVPEGSGPDRTAALPTRLPRVGLPAIFRRQAQPRREPTPGLVPQVLASLMAEISVVWLLFLGVFLVVVSSAVLAATQWQNFTSVGQYAILLGYTIAFWLVSEWCCRKPNLRLTARMLQITTLLIIPVNFWMIDGFQLWQSSIGWAIGLLASLGLSAILFRWLGQSSRVIWLNALGLSWLHWGWALPGIPLVATYVGTIGTALLQVTPATNDPESRAGRDVGLLTIAFATCLLVGRAVLAARLPLSALGLAIAICGWLLVWVNRRRDRPLVSQAGSGLLILGWAVTVSEVPPWQVLGVSGLGLWLLGDRLRRRWQPADLLALWLVGLQAFWLTGRLFPLSLQERLIVWATQRAGPDLLPSQLLSLTCFPYVVLTVGLATRLRRSQQAHLATVAEELALLLGGLLALIGWLNPLVRSLNLLATTLLLVVMVRQRSRAGIPAESASQRGLTYLTHITGLVTLLAWIRWGFPSLSLSAWAIVLLGVMLAEWGASLVVQHRVWRDSTWHLGLALAALSYGLLMAIDPREMWIKLVWLSVPIALTGLANRSAFWQPQLATWLSVIASVAAQLLQWHALPWVHSPIRVANWLIPSLGLPAVSAVPLLLSTGLATGLVWLNTHRLRHAIAAFVTISLGFSCVSLAVWLGLGDRFELSTWLGISAWGCWLICSWLPLRSELVAVYRPVLDGWAIGLSVLTLSVLTLTVVQFQLTGAGAVVVVAAAALITSAIGFRNRRALTDGGSYGLNWGIELLLVGSVVWQGASLEAFAIANLALALIGQLGADWWVARRAADRVYLPSWHLIPLLDAGLGLYFAHNFTQAAFTAVTGLYTLAAALTGIGVGRRQPSLKPLAIVAILLVSVGLYELLVYQLMQAQGGAFGDGVLMLALLATAIAVGYRCLSRWLLIWWRLTQPELNALTHLHWAIGSLLAMVAVVASLSPTASLLWLVAMGALAAYAIWQGRRQEWWVYAGVLEAVVAIGHQLTRLLPAQTLFSWGAVIASLFAVAITLLPWRSWGWPLRPWRNSAVGLPIAICWLTVADVAIPALFSVAAFYAWFALVQRQIRLSYFSVILVDWALLRCFEQWQVTEPLWYVAVLSASLLYGVQVDPAARSTSAREVRHLLRCFALGLFCLTALYQSDARFWQGLLTIAFSIGIVIVGLALRIRAFLYVGTVSFILKVLRQLWLFISDESLLLWALGIVLGLLLIWIAATFEARRSQAIAFVQYWITELEAWE